MTLSILNSFKHLSAPNYIVPLKLSWVEWGSDIDIGIYIVETQVKVSESEAQGWIQLHVYFYMIDPMWDSCTRLADVTWEACTFLEQHVDSKEISDGCS